MRSAEQSEGVLIENQWYDQWIQDLPNLDGKVAIVTGSNSGTGFWAANAMAYKKCTVVLACRSTSKAVHARTEILSRYPAAKMEVIRCDNMDLESVRAFCKAFKKKYNRLDYLVNNAGIMAQPWTLSKDGFDIQFQTNHLAHFLLTKLLWETMLKTPGQSRIVQHSSSAHGMGSPIFDRNRMHYPSYNWGWFGINFLLVRIVMPLLGIRPAENWLRYGVSKLCNVLFMRELATKIEENNLTSKVVSTACHPGYASTQLQVRAADSFANWQSRNKSGAQSAADGSMPLLHATLGRKVVNGAYYGPSLSGTMKGPPMVNKIGGNGNNKAQAKELWTYSEECIEEDFEI